MPSRPLPSVLTVRQACVETGLPKTTIESLFRAMGRDGVLIDSASLGIRRVVAPRAELQRRLEAKRLA